MPFPGVPVIFLNTHMFTNLEALREIPLLDLLWSITDRLITLIELTVRGALAASSLPLESQDW